jgi:phospholipid/cholesterol/gamma-HCH transport system substrate-binding protein
MIRGKAVTAGVIFLLVLAALCYALVIPRSVGGANTYQAEFTDAGLLASGDDVIEYGAKAGSVVGMRLTPRGTALVTFSLFSGVAPPRSDASVSVRPQNLLGGEYLSLSPGHAAQRLERPIATDRTFVATHLADLFNSFDRPTAAALNLLLGELGRALDARGADLNQAVLELAPVFGATDRVATQLSQQNAHLQDLIVNAEHVSAQVAPRTADIDRLIVGLQQTLQTTARGAAGLDRGLAELPATLSQTRHTLALLGSTASAARPLAIQLAAAAPEFTTAASRLPGFVADAGPAVEQLRPLVRQTYATLRAGRESLPRLSRSLHQVGSVTSPLRSLAKVLYPLADVAIQGLFGGLGGSASEPGTQPGDYEPDRHWFRGVAILSCESFGVAIAPGCLTTVLKTLSVPPIGGVKLPLARAAHPRPLAPKLTASTSTPTPSPARARTGSGAGGSSPGLVGNATGTVTKTLHGLLGSTAAPTGTGPSSAPPTGPMQTLLKYLLSP